jgi:hypothetical protein
MSDTAHESFVDGSPMWTRKAGEILGETAESIRNAVVKLNTPGEKRDALEFSFVFEQRHGSNRLAHGYAVALEDVVVLVQHMSLKPITSEFVRGLAVSLRPLQKTKP